MRSFDTVYNPSVVVLYLVIIVITEVWSRRALTVRAQPFLVAHRSAVELDSSVESALAHNFNRRSTRSGSSTAAAVWGGVAAPHVIVESTLPTNFQMFTSISNVLEAKWCR